MEKGIVTLAVVSLRSDTSNTSELEDQLLFGDMYEVVEREGEWLYICKEYDGYCGWINEKQHTEISQDEFLELKSKVVSYQRDNISGLNVVNGDGFLWLSKCSSLRGIEPGGRLRISGIDYEMYGNVYDSIPVDGSTIVGVAMDFLNVPYLWGGKTIMGIDCSGLTQLAFMVNGVSLPRNASLQAMVGGETINFVEEVEPGDLAFFGDDDKITHVGIIVDENHILHASGKVRIDTIDHEGIYNTEKGCYTHRLRLIKRMIN